MASSSSLLGSSSSSLESHSSSKIKIPDFEAISKGFPSFASVFNVPEFISLVERVEGSTSPPSKSMSKKEDVSVCSSPFTPTTIPLHFQASCSPTLESGSPSFSSRFANVVSSSDLYKTRMHGGISSIDCVQPPTNITQSSPQQVSVQNSASFNLSLPSLNEIDGTDIGKLTFEHTTIPTVPPDDSLLTEFVNVDTKPTDSRSASTPFVETMVTKEAFSECDTQIHASPADMISSSSSDCGLAGAKTSGIETNSSTLLPSTVELTTEGSSPTSSPSFFVGSVQIGAQIPAKAAETDPFHATKRTTLHYVKPDFINGQIFVRPKWDDAKIGMKRWTNTLVGYFIGKKPYFFGVKKFVLSIWNGLIEVKATSNGFYFFKFSTFELMRDVLEGGPWLYEGQALFLEKWREGMTLAKKIHKEIPIWIKLRHLPAEYWTLDGLSTVASAVGKPLYPDAFTLSMERIDYARVCVLMSVNDAFPSQFFMLFPSDSGEYNGSCQIDVEYEWKPMICKVCDSFGHVNMTCPKAKQEIRPPVNIYIPKHKVSSEITKAGDNEWRMAGSNHIGKRRPGNNSHPEKVNTNYPSRDLNSNASIDSPKTMKHTKEMHGQKDKEVIPLSNTFASLMEDILELDSNSNQGPISELGLDQVVK